METKLLVRIKNVYGTDTIYPANGQAEFIAELAGTRTLTAQAIRIAKTLGFTFEMEHWTLKI